MIDKNYHRLFVLAEWNLKKEELYVYFENEQKLKRIKKNKFKINQKSKEKLSISFGNQPFLFNWTPIRN